ncbi:MbeD family mobilization/exclusion protein (plasmid) [Photobacterium leiognathi subsp. mandapamensis]|uniref:MbeD family mobilization/exclusion protein n=1 Tax=Photobacterium leiognathi TaxID=553611 RepID=UPI003AF37ECD
MTELEQQLLSAFENLQSQHEKQHKDFAIAFKSLEKMFVTTSRENEALKSQVTNLSEQVSTLSIQLQQLEKQYIRKKV